MVLAWVIPSAYPTLCYKEITVLKIGQVGKKVTSFWNFVPNSRLLSQHVDHIVNKTCGQTCGSRLQSEMGIG